MWRNSVPILLALVASCLGHSAVSQHIFMTPPSSASDIAAVPQCYPFCAAGEAPPVSQVEAARYASLVSEQLAHVDPRIGTNGPDPSEYGGMVPSVALPFAAVRTVPMTRENLVSGCAYHDNDTAIIGWLASRQPAIWMGDYGFATLYTLPDGQIETDTEKRALPFKRENEFVSPYKHTVRTDDGLFAEMAGKSRSAMFQFTYENVTQSPAVVVQATRPEWRGAVYANPERGEITGYNPERMDYRLGPNQALNFKGHFVFRFEHQAANSSKWTTSLPADGLGTIHTNATGKTLHPGERARWNELGVYSYARFPAGTHKVRVRLGLSLISEEQARYNLEHEIPDGTTMDDVVHELIDAWSDKVDRIQVTGGTKSDKRILYTGIFHSSQYPAEHAEPLPPSKSRSMGSNTTAAYHYYSGYTDSVHTSPTQRYQSWSIWDVFRAQWGYLILTEPERIVDMVHSLLDIYDQSGYLPMWANLAETNIMIGTHADSLIAEAAVKGVRGFDMDKAWSALYRDATVPPEREIELRYEDREEYTPLEVRAGLSAYDEIGFVPLDGWSESSSRTLDYAYDDYAVSVFARLLNRTEDAERFLARSKNYANVFDPDQGLMAARLRNGTFLRQQLEHPLARQDGFTEGNQFDWSFDVVHDVDGLAKLLGGRKGLLALLDRHFREGHNNQSNEPSHHIPFLYALLGHPSRTQELVRSIAHEAFHDEPDGYAGNEDCGQQSAWFTFVSALGVYPVDPLSGQVVVGAGPFFDTVQVSLPNKKPLRISKKGTGDYVRTVTVDGKARKEPTIPWDRIGDSEWVFEMSETPVAWNS